MKELIRQEEMKPICTKNVMGIDLTIYGTLENPMFKAQDIAEILGYADTSKMMKNTLDSEKALRLLGGVLSKGNPNVWFVSEMGFYRICIKSEKPAAEQFQTKVAEILVDIRKHGFHATENTLSKWLENPDSMIEMIQKYKEEKDLRMLAEQKVEVLELKNKKKTAWIAQRLLPKYAYKKDEVAKTMSNSSTIEWTSQKLNKFLKEIGWVGKQGKCSIKARELDYMDTYYVKCADGKERPVDVITGKGQAKLISKMIQMGLGKTDEDDFTDLLD